MSFGESCTLQSHSSFSSTGTYVVPDDFPERLEHFREASGLSWAELNRRIGTHPQTMRRWRRRQTRPSTRHMLALLDLADSLGMVHLFTE